MRRILFFIILFLISTKCGHAFSTLRSISRRSIRHNCSFSFFSLTTRISTRRCVKRAKSNKENIGEENVLNDSNDEEQGSVFGASLLFAGTAIGAGMLALPAETAPAGFVPSISSLLVCWVFTVVTSIVTLEASWIVGEDTNREATFLSITEATLGPIAEGLTVLIFWFLLTSIIIAYTSEGGILVTQFSTEQLGNIISNYVVSPAIGSIIFMVFFSSLALFGTGKVDIVNRIFVTGLITSFLGLLSIGLPEINTDLLTRSDWGVVYPSVISIGILSFGAQNIVPTLLQYLGGDPVRTQRAVLLGSLIPLLMYSLWECVFLGILPYNAQSSESKMQVLNTLGSIGGKVVQELVEIFSACAIGSSMAGASVSLVDFFQDVIESIGGRDGVIGQSSKLNRRLLATALALGPPLVCSCIFPEAFLGALENAGLIGGVSLYGIVPALAVIRLRHQNDMSDDDKNIMPGRLFGGPIILYLLVAISAALVIPEFVRLGENVFR